MNIVLETAGGDGLIFTLREPSYEAIPAGQNGRECQRSRDGNEITANAEKSLKSGEGNSERRIKKRKMKRISGADGIELRLAVTAEQTDEQPAD